MKLLWLCLLKVLSAWSIIVGLLGTLVGCLVWVFGNPGLPPCFWGFEVIGSLVLYCFGLWLAVNRPPTPMERKNAPRF